MLLYNKLLIGVGVGGCEGEDKRVRRRDGSSRGYSSSGRGNDIQVSRGGVLSRTQVVAGRQQENMFGSVHRQP